MEAAVSHRGQALHNSQLADWSAVTKINVARRPILNSEVPDPSLLHWLRDQAKPQSEWLDAIATDQILTEPVRQRALQFARDWK